MKSSGKIYAPVTPFERQTSHCPLYVAWLVLDEARDYFRTIAGQPAPAHKPYYLLVLMDPRVAQLFHDFNLVAQSARGKHEVNLSLADEKNPEYIAGLFQQARPFYMAADWHPPQP
jgi:hypothetical protein